MNAPIVVRDELGERFYDASDFPLSIGRSSEADVRLPGGTVAQNVAFLGLHEGAPFVQAGESGIPVFRNERLVESSQWLQSGDTLRIETARIACEFSETRLEFRVAAAESRASDVPVIVVPPPSAPRGLDAPKPDAEIALPRRVRSRVSGTTWALSAVALLLLGLGWLLLTARAVELQVEPTADELTIEGAWLPLALGGRHLLRPGSYVVVAEKRGYHSARLPIEVGEASSQSFSLRLERLPGLLSVRAGDVEGARVSADGALLGVTPLVDAELSAGVHSLLVESRRHLPATLELSIEGGGERQSIEVELTPAWSPFAFVSDPPGAELRVDGEALGNTPITAELGAGARVVELALAGFETWRAELLVRADQPLETRDVRLAPAPASVALRSRPSGASVTVDGRFRGRTPTELSLTPSEEHRIDLFKQGHEPARRALRFEAGERRSVDVTLVPQYGELDLVSEPADAELFVDGDSRGIATQRLRLSAVPHQLEVRKQGYESFRSTVTPQPGFPESLNVTLSTLEAVAEGQGLPERIRSGNGQDLLLVKPGSFEMGAPRREQGRQSNEVLRSVVLTRPVYVATREVTNAQFRQFAPRHSSGLFESFSLDGDAQPAVRVSWAEAARYCNWLSARDGLPAAYVERDGKPSLVLPPTLGYRLITEAEWAWAARYAGGIQKRRYPWGEALPPTALSGNYADASARELLPNVLSGYRDDFPVSAPAGSFKPNALGIHDLGGNAAEWVHDYYLVSAGSQVEPDPMGPASGRFHVVRGSSWQDSSITELRLSYRDHASGGRPDLGFRIARYAR